MAAPKKVPPRSASKSKKRTSTPLVPPISDERKKEILGLVLMVVALLCSLAVLTFSVKDETLIERAFNPSAMGVGEIPTSENALGRIGALIAYWLVPSFLGYFTLVFPLAFLILWGYYTFRNKPHQPLIRTGLRMGSIALMLSTITGWMNIVFSDTKDPVVPHLSGCIGIELANILIGIFGSFGSVLILFVLVVIGLMLTMDRDVQTSVDRAEDFFFELRERLSRWISERESQKEQVITEKPLPFTTPKEGIFSRSTGEITPVPQPEAQPLVTRSFPALVISTPQASFEPTATPPPSFIKPEPPIVDDKGQTALPLTIRPTIEEPASQLGMSRALPRISFAADFSIPSLELLTDGENEARKVAEAEAGHIEQFLREVLQRRAIIYDAIETQRETTHAHFKIRITNTPDVQTLKVLEEELVHQFAHARITIPLWSSTTLAVEVSQRARTQSEEAYDELIEAITNANLQISALNQTKTQAGLLYELVPSQDVDVNQLHALASGLAHLPNTRCTIIPREDAPSLTIRVPTKTGLELEHKKELLVEKLRTYNIELRGVEAVVGPTVTLFELTPAPGVKISKIKSLEDDLAMALAAKGIRIIAPIPGKAAIGIEIPNKHREFVRVRSILAADKFRHADHALPVAMGKTIEGEVYIEDLTKMPHLLIAGATGSGKSVGVNCLITGLLYHCHPNDLKFVMIDPKKIELLQYGAIANHYIAMPESAESPIITDYSQAFGILKSCEKEMEMRYDLLSDLTVRGIRDYNRKLHKNKLEGTALKEHAHLVHRHLPYIVVIVDELADLMMTAGKEIEGPIARLAQMARAVGIHLVLATQRPSVDVITGLIKANFPARMAYQVASRIDSRTILDQMGAEQLVGNGDLLYMSGSRMIRLQGPFISVDEVEEVTQFIANQRGPGPYLLPSVDEGGEAVEPASMNGGGSADRKDPLFDDCARVIVRAQQGSVSLLQRKFSIGYTRAARIVDQLERAGVVGAFEGSKARAVLIHDEQFLEEFLKEVQL
ncbi:MAG TPA: DNA translocase FtsK 4TM domain-containing protein [Rhodothermales bacterium]|nr:DNA translocase FtsK 4TM domain-containing protein [Rhodothermales bacterium]